METEMEKQLSAELQEVYLENKEWLSDVLFLEDEIRFFQQILKKAIIYVFDQKDLEEIEVIKANINHLQERKEDLKSKLNHRQQFLNSILKNEIETITIDFIEEDSAIVTEIKTLLATVKEIKNDLFTLIERLHIREKLKKYLIL